MPPAQQEFAALVHPVLERFFLQTGRPAPAAVSLAEFVARLWQLVTEHGVPPPLPPGERGEPGEMPAAEVAPLIERLLSGLSAEEQVALATPARQLVKACLQGDFKTCRDSFREVSPDGSCRRQELSRVRERISGTHCVDCPYWLSLTPGQHARFLAREWRSGAPEEFAAQQAIFLPEDYRALRCFIRLGPGRNRS
jgi:hypothetical protein